ncbi:MAG: epimerase [Candidatus Melainabacteria bacterium GWF2_32_7]|nr:MAG: epimerase [Candidatus Melainabacteria bacterium GWF2_32_7]
MKVLLTGGNGFIGKNILESYLAKKYEIIAPRSFELNLIDQKSVDDFFKDHKIDIIIHSACKPGHRNAKDTSNLFYTNTRMFYNLLRHKDRYKKFINIGSGGIYDCCRSISKIKEEFTDMHMPADEHGFCKYIVEKQTENLENYVDLRIFGIFGKYEDYSIRFISNAICKTLFDLPITIKQNRKFDYIFVEDLMPILDFFIENNSAHKAYNITPDHSVELLKLGELIKEISGKDLPIIIAQEGLGLEYSGDNSRLKNEHKTFELTSVEDSVNSLYDWYSKNKSTLNKNLLLVDK